MFFDLIDRRYEKEGPKCMIFTSNKQPMEWSAFFKGEDDLKAALDRMFDEAKKPSSGQKKSRRTDQKKYDLFCLDFLSI